MLKENKDRRDNDRKVRAEKRKTITANAEKYYKGYKEEEQSLVDSKRKAKAAGNFFIQPEAKVAFAIRTRG